MHDPSRDPVWQDEVTELLQPYTSRTVRLHVTLGKATVPDLLLKDAPMLEHLTLKSNLPVAPRITVVQPEPRLRSLTLSGIMLSVGMLSAFGSCWTHLTRLRVRLGNSLLGRDIKGPVVLTLLAPRPHLQDFAFFIADMPPDITVTYAARALTHSNLNSLDVTVLRGTGFLLAALTLPVLRHLVIRNSTMTSITWRQNEFRGFVTRSRCPLETLKFQGGRALSKEDPTEYVALIPILRHVEVQELEVGSEVGV